MPTEKGLSNLIINKVESKEVYNYMVANNLVNEDEMYLVQGDDEAQIIVDSALNTTSKNPVQNKVVATAINNLNTLVGDTPVNTAVENALTEAKNSGELQADYAENDERQVAYIKNRPFYARTQIEHLRTNFTLKLSDSRKQSDGTYYDVRSIQVKTGNNTYVIEKLSYEGKATIVRIQDGHDGSEFLISIIGNESLLNDSIIKKVSGRGQAIIKTTLTDTGENFAVGFFETTNITFLLSTEFGLEISNTDIVEKYDELKQLDEKYIPDTIQRVADMPTDYVTYTTQTLTEDQKKQVRTNIGAISSDEVTGVVKYTAQSLTDTQKAQARTNIGAGTSSFDGAYSSLTGAPRLAAVATSGDYNDLSNVPVQFSYNPDNACINESGSMSKQDGKALFDFLVAGERYAYRLNGTHIGFATAKELTPQSGDTYRYIGNFSLGHSFGENTGENWLISAQKSAYGTYSNESRFDSLANRPYEVIKQDSVQFTQLLEAYIPSTIQRVGDPVILSDANGAKWRLIVGTDGALTTEAVTE